MCILYGRQSGALCGSFGMGGERGFESHGPVYHSRFNQRNKTSKDICIQKFIARNWLMHQWDAAWQAQTRGRLELQTEKRVERLLKEDHILFSFQPIESGPSSLHGLICLTESPPQMDLPTSRKYLYSNTLIHVWLNDGHWTLEPSYVCTLI